MLKAAIITMITFLLSLAVAGAVVVYGQEVSPTTSVSPTVSPSPSGAVQGATTTIPSGAPKTGRE